MRPTKGVGDHGCVAADLLSLVSWVGSRRTQNVELGEVAGREDPESVLGLASTPAARRRPLEGDEAALGLE
eukprot:12464400-Heterocapsa_arctica.AAC.1